MNNSSSMDDQKEIRYEFGEGSSINTNTNTNSTTRSDRMQHRKSNHINANASSNTTATRSSAIRGRSTIRDMEKVQIDSRNDPSLESSSPQSYTVDKNISLSSSTSNDESMPRTTVRKEKMMQKDSVNALLSTTSSSRVLVLRRIARSRRSTRTSTSKEDTEQKKHTPSLHNNKKEETEKENIELQATTASSCHFASTNTSSQMYQKVEEVMKDAKSSFEKWPLAVKEVGSPSFPIKAFSSQPCGALMSQRQVVQGGTGAAVLEEDVLLGNGNGIHSKEGKSSIEDKETLILADANVGDTDTSERNSFCITRETHISKEGGNDSETQNRINEITVGSVLSSGQNYLHKALRGVTSDTNHAERQMPSYTAFSSCASPSSSDNSSPFFSPIVPSASSDLAPTTTNDVPKVEQQRQRQRLEEERHTHLRSIAEEQRQSPSAGFSGRQSFVDSDYVSPMARMRNTNRHVQPDPTSSSSKGNNPAISESTTASHNTRTPKNTPVNPNNNKNTKQQPQLLHSSTAWNQTMACPTKTFLQEKVRNTHINLNTCYPSVSTSATPNEYDSLQNEEDGISTCLPTSYYHTNPTNATTASSYRGQSSSDVGSSSVQTYIDDDDTDTDTYTTNYTSAYSLQDHPQYANTQRRNRSTNSFTSPCSTAYAPSSTTDNEKTDIFQSMVERVKYLRDASEQQFFSFVDYSCATPTKNDTSMDESFDLDTNTNHATLGNSHRVPRAQQKPSSTYDDDKTFDSIASTFSKPSLRRFSHTDNNQNDDARSIFSSDLSSVFNSIDLLPEGVQPKHCKKEKKQKSSSKISDFTVQGFLTELTQGIPLKVHSTSTSPNYVPPSEILFTIKKSKYKRGKFVEPTLVWTTNDYNDSLHNTNNAPLGKLDIFDVTSVEGCTTTTLPLYPFAIPSCSFLLTHTKSSSSDHNNTNSSILFEATSKEEQRRLIHALQTLIPWLTFHLVAGNKENCWDFFDSAGAFVKEDVSTLSLEELGDLCAVKALNDVTTHLVEKTTVQMHRTRDEWSGGGRVIDS